MLFVLIVDLGGWNSWRRTFLSVLGAPFPPTTLEKQKLRDFHSFFTQKYFPLRNEDFLLYQESIIFVRFPWLSKNVF